LRLERELKSAVLWNKPGLRSLQVSQSS